MNKTISWNGLKHLIVENIFKEEKYCVITRINTIMILPNIVIVV